MPVDPTEPNGATAGSGRAESDDAVMDRALALGAAVQGTTSPNPWVGCVIVPAGPPRGPGGDRELFTGATAPPGGPHAEVQALAAAGEAARGATMYVTLEPCNHQGRTPACVQAIVGAGIRRVVVAVEDPDPKVAGRGIGALREAGVEVSVGTGAGPAADLLAPYLKHRRTGRPWVVLKLAATLDGRCAAPDGSSQWITGEAARRDVQRLRALSDAILVGAGTVRADDPALTVRLEGDPARQPLRVVLGRAPAGARVHPALEMSGDLGVVLQELGSRGVLQLLVEGGSDVAHRFHTAGLVDRYVLYLAPAFAGGDDSRPMFAGPGAPTIGALWRGRMISVTPVGEDLRVEVAA